MSIIKNITVTTKKMVEVEETDTFVTEREEGLCYAAMYSIWTDKPKVVALFDNLTWARRFLEHTSVFTLMDLKTGKTVD